MHYGIRDPRWTGEPKDEGLAARWYAAENHFEELVNFAECFAPVRDIDVLFFFGASQNIMTLVLSKCFQIAFIWYAFTGLGNMQFWVLVKHSQSVIQQNMRIMKNYANYWEVMRPCSTAAQPTTNSTVHALQHVNRLQNQLSMFYTRTTTPPSNLHKIKDPTLNSAALGTSIPTYRVFTKSTAPRKNAALTKSPTPPPQKLVPGNELFCLQYRSSFAGWFCKGNLKEDYIVIEGLSVETHILRQFSDIFHKEITAPKWSFVSRRLHQVECPSLVDIRPPRAWRPTKMTVVLFRSNCWHRY